MKSNASDQNATTFEYMETMLAQLRSMSEERGEHFLTYLVEMAMQEAGTLHKIAIGELISVPGSTDPQALADAYMKDELG